MKNRLKNAYMITAYIFANLSYAKRLKVGCIIVKDERILSIGYNGTPSGWSNECEIEKQGKLISKDEVIHAEANCLGKLGKCNDSSKDADMFITHSPCIYCAKLIYVAGIRAVYFKEEFRDLSSLDFLRMCGIHVEQLH
jgi:dCMP deaminase